LIPPLCFVTDGSAPRPLADQAECAAQGGACWIQLRHKTLPIPEFQALALAIRQRIQPHGAELIINDHVDVACAINAFGVHIGQSDGDPRAIRKRVGPHAILGLSIENETQLVSVPDDCVTYLGVGPVRATATTVDHAPPIGFEGLIEITRIAVHPCLAIGGLGATDVPRIKAAGCAGLAVVSAIAQAADPTAATRTIMAEWAAS